MNFIYFYEPSIPRYDAIIDSFFKKKYDLNKKYIKVNTSKKSHMKNYPEINYAPCLLVCDKNNTYLGEIPLIDESEIISNLEKYYNNIIV